MDTVIWQPGDENSVGTTEKTTTTTEMIATISTSSTIFDENPIPSNTDKLEEDIVITSISAGSEAFERAEDE